MFTYIILLWILINMSAPVWTYVLLGIAAFITILKWGIELANKSEQKANSIVETEDNIWQQNRKKIEKKK